MPADKSEVGIVVASSVREKENDWLDFLSLRSKNQINDPG